jgi:hypothetical protein
MLNNQLQEFCSGLPLKIVGPLSDGTEKALRMPRRSNDGRALAWEKFKNEVTVYPEQSIRGRLPHAQFEASVHAQRGGYQHG